MKYILALLIAFTVSLPLALAQNGNDMMPNGMMEDDAGMMVNDDTMMSDRGMMMDSDGMMSGSGMMMNDGMMMHKSKMYSRYHGDFGWEHVGWMLFHLVAWIVFLALSTFVVRWSWDRAGHRK